MDGLGHIGDETLAYEHPDKLAGVEGGTGGGGHLGLCYLSQESCQGPHPVVLQVALRKSEGAGERATELGDKDGECICGQVGGRKALEEHLG